jgi:hypothetical protein
MNILRRFISSVLSEAALGPRNVPDGCYVHIKELTSKHVTVLLFDANQTVLAEAGMEQDPDSDVWFIATTHAEGGWGPLVYDVAMEWASMNGSGLASDRDIVSQDALRVWGFYKDKRPDVKHHILPKELLGKDAAKPDAAKSPLAYRYTKQPTAIGELKKLGKLRVG